MNKNKDILKTLASLGIVTAFGITNTLSAVSASPSTPTPGNKNIVFVLADDLGWKDLSCYGSTYHKTPNLDKMAQNGVRFTDAYAAAPLCSATRASVLTGFAPARQHITAVTPHTRNEYNNGFYDYEDWDSAPVYRPHNKIDKATIPYQLGQFPLHRITIAKMLKEKDYKTAYFGKWHLGPDADKYPDKHGFDVNFGGNNFGWPPSYFDPYGLDTLENKSPGEYLTDRLTDEAVSFIKESKEQNKPFLAYVAHYAVHDPWQAKPEDIDLFKGIDDPQGLQGNKVYAGMIKSLDDSVGKLMKTVEDLGISNDTLFVFVSDNGGIPYLNGEHITSVYPLRGNKSLTYEGGIRVPMIAYMPGYVESGKVISKPVITTDLFPTFLEFANISPKENNPMDGKSLIPLFTGNGEFERDVLTWFFPHRMGVGTSDFLPPNAVIREGDYKLINVFNDRFELYNLKEDISEKNNLSLQLPELVTSMNTKLMAELNNQNAHIPIPNPSYDAASAESFQNDPKNKPKIYNIYDSVVLEDTFSENTTGWETTGTANISRSEYLNKTKYLKFSYDSAVLLTKGDTNNNNYQAFHYALGNQIESPDSSTDISVSFKLYIESLERNNANPVIQFKGSAGNTTVFTSINIDPSTNIATIAGTTRQLARRRWYDVKWVYNTTSRAYSVYFDNSLVVSGISTSALGGDGTNSKFGLVSYSTQNGSEVLFDDIVIKNGETIVSSNDMQTNTNGWTKPAGASILQIAEEPTSISSKALFIKGDISKAAYQEFYTLTSANQAGTNVEVSFKFRIPYINSDVAANQIIQLRNQGLATITKIEISKGYEATFYSRNGSVSGTLNLPKRNLSADKWYDVKFIIDTTTKKMWAYLDNQVIINELYCINDPVAGVRYISGHVQKDTEMILDEVKVTNNGTTPLLHDFETGTNSWVAPASGAHILQTREYASKLYANSYGYSDAYATIKRTVDLTGLTNKIYLAEISLNPDVVNDTIPITFKNAADSVAQIVINKQDVLPNANRFEKTYERSNNLDLKVYLDFVNKVYYTVMNDVIVGFKMPFSTEQTTFDSVELGLKKSSKLMINSFKITALYGLPSITRPDSFEVRSNITDENNNPIDSIVGIAQAGGIFKVVNNNDNAQSLVGILTFFEDQKLVDVKTLPINIAANGYTNVNIADKITISMTDGKAYSIKLVLWDSLSNMTPITNMSLIKSESQANFRTGPLFTNNMVLQRDYPVPIYGSAPSGSNITVVMGEQTKTTTASSGKWSVTLDPVEGGYTTYDMSIVCQNASGTETKTLTNVVFGDVWFASGQSNMDWNLFKCIPDATINTSMEFATNSNIRFFKTIATTDVNRDFDLAGHWSLVSPSTAANMSAVCYYFAEDLQPSIDVTVGIVQAAWGGTKIESWMNPQTFDDDSDFSEALTLYQSQTPLVTPADDPDVTRHIPGKLYQSMINPNVNYALKGYLWYQGESNAWQSNRYVKQLSSMITDWRSSWGQGNLPFYIVQLPAYNTPGYPAMRMAQAKVAQEISNTGLVVTIDTGDYEDIHPTDKNIVGQRMSILARKLTYDQDISVYKSPEYLSKTINGNSITIDFKDIGSGLVATDVNNVPGFEIAGNDGVYYSATAVLSDNKVTISNQNVSNPTKIKYAQTGWPEVTLKNIEGFPVAPFIVE